MAIFSVANPCLMQPSVVGTGNVSLSRWAYDNKIHQCIQFIYSGRRGNANNFLTALLCKDACPGKKTFKLFK